MWKNKKCILSKLSAILWAIIVIMELPVCTMEVLAAGEKVYCVDGDVCDYISGDGSYFSVERNFYRDESGSIAYCLEADKLGPEKSGTDGYRLNNSFVCDNSNLVKELKNITRMGYPSGYIEFNTSDYIEKDLKSGLYINDIFYECDETEARAVTSFAIHKLMYDYSVANNTVDQDCVIKSYRNGRLAKHDLVAICDALLSAKDKEYVNPSIDIAWGDYSNGKFSELTKDEIFDNSKYREDGSFYVYARVLANNCYIEDICLDDKSLDGYADISEFIYASNKEIYVKVLVYMYGTEGRYFGICCDGRGFSSEIKILGNDRYQDILVAPSNYSISNSSKEEMSIGNFKIYKYDSATKRPLPGVCFGIYADYGCDLLMEKVVTDENGIAVVEGLHEGFYFYKELECPKGYILDDTVRELELVVNCNSGFEVYNSRHSISIEICKQDSANGKNPLGDATFYGAKYGVFAKNTVYSDASNLEVYYEADELVCEIILDEQGKGRVDDIAFGEYYVKELEAPTGYMLNPSKYDVNIAEEELNTDIPRIEKTVNVTDDIKKQPFKIFKYYLDGIDKKSLSGAGFSACLLSDLEKDDDGNWIFDMNKTVVIGEDNKKVLFTDDNGWITSIPLPYGKYLIRETIVPDGFIPAGDFIVEIGIDDTENPVAVEVENKKREVPKNPVPEVTTEEVTTEEVTTEEVTTEEVTTEEVTAEEITTEELTIEEATTEDNEIKTRKVLFQKKDSLTGEFVSGAELELLDSNNCVVDSWTSDEKIHNIDNLNINEKYLLREKSAPYGYLKADDIEFEVFEDTSKDQIITMFDDMPRGTIKLCKVGVNEGNAMLLSKSLLASDSDGIDEEVEGPLEGVSFCLYAANDICRFDSEKTVKYKAGELIASGNTDSAGMLEFADLDIGEYMIVEISTDSLHIVKEEPIYISVEYIDSYTKEIVCYSTVYNRHIKSNICINKIDGNTRECLAGVEFSVFALDDIYDNSGNKIFGKDELVTKGVTDELGNVVFNTVNYPGKYYLLESKAIEGYTANDEKYEFEIEPSKDYELNLVVENYRKPIASSTSIYKPVVDETVSTGDSVNLKLLIFVLVISFVGFVFLIKKNCGKN